MTSDKQTAAAQRPAVRIWTEEEKDIVWEQAVKAKENSLPLTEAFRRAAKILPHRSEAAVGMLYYNVLRKEREEPKAPAPAEPEFKVDKRLLEAFQGLPEYIQQLNKRIKTLEERQQKPDPLLILKALAGLAAELENSGEHELQLTDLRSKKEALAAENKALQADIERLKQAYEDALGIYDMFTNMASISQIMSLGDFKQQMKTTLDKWGNVLEITFDRQL